MTDGSGITGLFGEGALAGAAERCRRLAEGIDGHEVVRLLGSGAEGAVFEARSPRGERVALKASLPDGRGGEPRERARRAFDALSRLDHPGVVRPRALLEERAGLAAFTMDFVDGVPLDEWVERAPGAARIERALAAALAVARALDHCHGRGVVHRDVKPGNVLVRADGSPVLVDFGTARDAGALAATRSFEVKGTIGYMAPEQFMPGAPLDGRADVFSLGATLAVVLAGRPRIGSGAARHEALAAPLRALAAAEGGGPPACVGSHPAARRGVDPERLAAALVRATELEPERRFATMAAFAEELDACLRGERRPRPSRPRARRLAAAASLLALAGLAAAVLLSRETDAVGARIDLSRGVAFVDAAGREVGLERIDLSGLEDGHVKRARSGDRLAVAPGYADRPGEVHLFDLGRARRAPGWERPFVLEGASLPGWRPIDPYDPAVRAFRARDVLLADLDGDGAPEPLALLGGMTWASCALLRIDPATRRPGGAYLQDGDFDVFALADLDGDGVPDPACAGLNNCVRFEGVEREYSAAFFAVSGALLLRDGERREGPPGRPDLPGGFDAPLLFYQVLGPLLVGGRPVAAQVVAPRWLAAEERFDIAAAPFGRGADGFHLSFDRAGRHLGTVPVREAPDVAPPSPTALVLGGRSLVDALGPLVEEKNGGARVRMLRLRR